MTHEHTPEPWEAKVMPDGVWVVIDPDSDNADLLALVDPDNTREELGQSAKANAHLISASPSLLMALKATIPILIGALAFVDCKSQLETARTAIAKAEGRS